MIQESVISIHPCKLMQNISSICFSSAVVRFSAENIKTAHDPRYDLCCTSASTVVNYGTKSVAMYTRNVSPLYLKTTTSR